MGSFDRDFGSLARLELSREEAREEDAEGGATGRYWDECCLEDRKRVFRMI